MLTFADRLYPETHAVARRRRRPRKGDLVFTDDTSTATHWIAATYPYDVKVALRGKPRDNQIVDIEEFRARYRYDAEHTLAGGWVVRPLT